MGFKGLDCEKAAAFLEEALGVVGQKIKKREYHQRSTRVSQQKLAGKAYPTSARKIKFHYREPDTKST